LFGQYGAAAVFQFSAVVLVLWLILAATMREPKYLATQLVNVGSVSPERAAELTRQLAAIKGVAEVVVNVEDGVAYLKVDSRAVDAAALNRFSAATVGVNATN
jgi:hypothetical protein